MPIMPYGLDVVGDGPDFVGSRAAALTLRPALVLDLTSELLPFRGLVEYVDGSSACRDRPQRGTAKASVPGASGRAEGKPEATNRFLRRQFVPVANSATQPLWSTQSPLGERGRI